MARPALVPKALRSSPFRGTAAIAAGLLTAEQLRSGVWRRLFYDVYVYAGVPDTHHLRIRAAQLIIPPNAIITGRSAASIWGVGLATADDAVEILSPRRMRTQTGLSIRRGTIDPAEITSVGGIPTPKPLHVAWEIARAYRAVEAIAWLDALAKVKHLDAADLVRHARRHFGEYGARRAADTLALVDRRSESPPESRLRIHLHETGFPTPKPQWNVYVDGKFVARVDLAWPDLKFAIEYDGLWHADPAQLGRDRARIRKLNAAGWYVYPVTSRDMHDVPRLIRDLSAALATR